MRKPKLVAFVLVFGIVSLSSCKSFSSTSSADGVVPGEISPIIDELPTYNPDDPPPSPGAAALRALGIIEPHVAELESSVEAAESAALEAGLANLSDQISFENGVELPAPMSSSENPIVAVPYTDVLFLSSNNLIGELDGVIDTTHDVALVTALVSGMHDILVPDLESGAATSGSSTETRDNSTATMNMEIGNRADGTTNFGLGLQTASAKSGISANTDFAGSIDGQRCPNAEGQVSFTVKVRLGAESGGAAYTQDLTALVQAVVDDGAQIASTTIDVTQGTRQVKDGRQVYVESGYTRTTDGDDLANSTVSNLRLIRKSQEATLSDVGDLSSSGHDAGLVMAWTALRMAEDNWLTGGCTKIQASSPGTVRPGSSTAIPVTVLHRFDGSEVPSKLEAVLTGGESVEPTSLARTPGTLMYTAPNENLKTATITLTSTSRRGRATLKLTVNTGGQAYRVSGESNQVAFSGEICSLDKPFTIDATFPGGTAITTFTPGSAADGVTSMSGSGSGCTQSGGGTYTVALNEDGSGTITWIDTGTVACPGLGVSNSKTNTFELPLQPAADLSCP